jgi:threonine/homoserine/homoserine lactone efflux protein
VELVLSRNKKDAKSLAEQRRAGPAVGFGTSFAVGMALFALGGHWLDKKTDRESLFTLIGIGFGLLYGAWELWKLVAMTNEQDREEKEPRQNEPEK